MQHEKNQKTNTEALEALMNAIPPHIAAKTITTLFNAVIPKDDFCCLQEGEREEIFCTANLLIGFFNVLKSGGAN